ncbi:hypothetical protein MU852_03460 [Brevundimonas albigilva]|uniref:VirB4 family type IV secretion/conjugal transfer ATPase n=1 Tax=Brevundimonas albigilva TaxID=1312364 RepID=UPI00201B7D96|nr:hypothetical protein [Brevundimonas albigilva]UQV19771.1 hypothetical protein MU852_03460 [Brevundimonas albigilva]
MRLRREADARPHLTYARHVSDAVVALDSGALMMVFQIDGASFETADARDLNDWHVKLNQAWRNLADDRLAVWHHVVRRPAELARSVGFRSDFAGELGALYDDRVAGRQLWINELFVTLVLHPGREAGDRAAALARRLKAARRADVEVETAHLQRVEEAGRDLIQYLDRYAPRRLGLYERDGLWFSEPMEVMRLVLTGRRSAVPIVFGHLGAAVHTVRAIFGREILELRDVADARYAGVLAVKEYPATTRPGLWDDLLSVRFGFVASQSFAFLSKAAARTVMERKQNQMVSARDRAASQITGLSDALDDLVSNRFVMGEHQASILVHGDTPAALADHLSKARAILADSGLVVAREDLGLEAAFWSQFPGAFARRTRPAAITSRNSPPWRRSTPIRSARPAAITGARPSRCCAPRPDRPSGSTSMSAIWATPSSAVRPARARRSCRTSCWPSLNASAPSSCSSTRTAALRSSCAPAAGPI